MTGLQWALPDGHNRTGPTVRAYCLIANQCRSNMWDSAGIDVNRGCRGIVIV